MRLYPTILRKIATTRRRPRPWQAFAFSHAENAYWFGLIVRTDVPYMAGHASLAYLYDVNGSTPSLPADLAQTPHLRPPILLERSTWSSGFVQLLEVMEPLKPSQVVPHVFYDPVLRSFFDVDKAAQVPDPGIPTDIYGTWTHGGLNAALCERLNIPPEDLADP